MYFISVFCKIKILVLKLLCGRLFFFFNRRFLEVVWDWNGIGEDCGNFGIGIGEGSWVDFGDDGVGFVEVVDLVFGVVDEDFDDVGVDLRVVF